MNRVVVILALITGSAGCSSMADPMESGQYVVTESCTKTVTCPDGGTEVSVYSYETGPSDSETIPGGSSTYTPGGGSTTGTGGSTTGTAPNPDSPGGYVDGGTSGGSTGGSNGGSTGGSSGGSTGSMCSTVNECTPSCKDNTGKDCGTQPPSEGGCWVTGGGFILDADGQDSFGGNAMPMKAGYVRGEWQHVDHGTMDKGHGQVKYIVCRHVDGEPGPGHPNGPQHNFDINQVYFGGPARWYTAGQGWADGYWFDVMAEDHGEPGNVGSASKGHGSGVPDYYHYTIRQMVGTNMSGAVIYDTEGPFQGGNLQIHPANAGHPYNGGTLPQWVSLQP